MQIKASRYPAGLSNQILLVMKLTVLLIMVATLQVTARGFGQTVSFSGREVPLKTVFKAIRAQTGYVVFYDNALLSSTRPVTVDVQNAPLNTLLATVLKNQGLTYSMNDKTITLKRLYVPFPDPYLVPPPPEVGGRVLNEAGKPVPNVNIMIKGTKKWTQTDADGSFMLKDVADDAVLVLTAVNIEPQEIAVKGRSSVLAVVKTRVSELDDVQIIAYGATTRRFNTGSQTHVSSEEIAKQPVANVLQALQAIVPGLRVVSTSGIGSASFNTEIRGQNSIAYASSPLFIIDGVPLIAGGVDLKNTTVGSVGDAKNLGVNQNFMVSGITQSPLFSMNPADIESIDVLKDADATAIYGSQGANGVILITTKRGKPGKTKFDVNVYSGAGKVTRMNKLLNTEEYLALRREAYKNDNLAPNVTDAPDLLVWDQHRYTDWQEMLIGNTARTTDAQAGISGGDEFTTYRVSGGYHRQSDVTTASGSDKRASFSLNLNTTTKDRRFRMSFSGSYSGANSNQTSFDNSLISLPPNAPSVYDSTGKLNFKEWGSYNSGFLGLKASNPFGPLLRPYTAVTDNLQSNLQVQYQPIARLTLKVSGGYSLQQNTQLYITPKASFDLTTNPTSNTRFGNNSVKTWIAEPTAEYYINIGRGRLSAMAGGTYQSSVTKGFNTTASNFPNEALLRTMSAAATVTIYQDSYVPYRYNAVFGRLNYIWASKYLVNATARRDGSSRFGPGRQFGNFGAIGAAWIFSEEPFFKKNVPFISFGKLRGSYGVTGSANIGDYGFLSQWKGTGYSYQGSATLMPSSHYDPNIAWEENRKLEAGLELGLLKDRIQIITSWYRNRSENQLVSMPFPVYTGFPSLTTNLAAVVENTGWEVSVSSSNIKTKTLSWNSSFNISIPRNRLVSYPGLASSPYALIYEVGKPLTLQRLLHFTGVNPQTGAPMFTDVNKDTKTTATGVSNDLVPGRSKASEFYGGLSNTFQYKSLQLSFMLQFVKQAGYLYKNTIAMPGGIYNQPRDLLQHWQKPGDLSARPKVSTILVNDYINYEGSSDALLTDASFVRLQNVSLSYTLPAKWTRNYKSSYTRVYIQTQNLLVFTPYEGADPETQNFSSVPPVRFITAGIQLTF